MDLIIIKSFRSKTKLKITFVSIDIKTFLDYDGSCVYMTQKPRPILYFRDNKISQSFPLVLFESFAFSWPLPLH